MQNDASNTGLLIIQDISGVYRIRNGYPDALHSTDEFTESYHLSICLRLSYASIE